MTSSTPSVRAGYIAVLAEYLAELKIDLATALDAPEISILQKARANDRIPITQYALIMDQVAKHLDDAALPLHLATRVLPRHLGILGSTLLHCANLGETALLLQRYERLVDDINDTHFTLAEGKASVEWISRIPNPHPFFAQMSLGVWVTFARRMTGRPDLTADVDFSFEPPANLAPYQKHFGGQVRFRQKQTRLLFPIEHLSLPLQLQEPQAHSVLLQQLQQQYEAQIGEAEIILQIKQLIQSHLSQGRATLEILAQALNITPRTLQNRLATGGIRFRDLLDDERFRLAESYLANEDISLAEVAFLLGYSEQSTFQHAFKRRYGTTPGEFRRIHGR
ncbi:Transcriptional regulator, AraC family [gamma proteobacterium HdN1]|nr:Transcriptional regulator, AraC family [gamma proteobacterium HdN1]